MEKWADIEGYEGMYQVSDKGRVRSVERTVVDVNGQERKYKSVIRKQRLNRDGYINVTLKSSSKNKTLQVHRLVAKAFLEKEQGKDIVNHKDGVRHNNIVENLEWCTYSENYKDACLRKKLKRQRIITS